MPVTVRRPGDPFPEVVTRSIFLSGPAAKPGRPDRRQQVIRYLDSIGWTGDVFDPIILGHTKATIPDAVFEWQRQARKISDIVLIDLEGEGGVSSAGTREEAERHTPLAKAVTAISAAQQTDPLVLRMLERNTPVVIGLRPAVDEAVRLIGPAVERRDGERFVPIQIYRTPQFKNWLDGHKANGSYLLDADVLWVHRFTPDKLFGFAIHFAIKNHIDGEIKDIEFVVFRPDMSHVVPIFPNVHDPEDPWIISVTEFRSANTARLGAVEPPGGSPKLGSSLTNLEVGREELGQETGIWLDPSRFFNIGSYQAASTITAHRVHVHGVILQPSEFRRALKEANVVMGEREETERVTRLILRRSELQEGSYYDLVAQGMLSVAMHNFVGGTMWEQGRNPSSPAWEQMTLN